MKTIKKTDTVYSVVVNHPELRQVLKETSPKFARLDNPVLFNTVARVTSLEQAAKIGGVYLRELLYRLNETLGLGAAYLAEEKAAISEALKDGKGMTRAVDAASKRTGGKTGKGTEAAAGETAPPAWLERAAAFPRMDVRSDGLDPFERLTKIADGTEAEGGFILIQSFEPVPLIRYLAGRGFESYTYRKAGDEYWVYFIKK
jgi:hypothetical protein